MIKVSLSWEWHGTFDDILNYKSFSLPPFNATNQTNHYYFFPKNLYQTSLKNLN